MKKIESICHRVFEVIGSCPANAKNPRFENFPRGCCGVGTEIIGTYLYSNGFGIFNYINAQNEYGVSHAWAQNGSLIVDLTVAQFSADMMEYMVVNESDSPFHRRFSKSGIVRPINLYDGADFKIHPILPFYEYIVLQLRGIQ